MERNIELGQFESFVNGSLGDGVKSDTRDLVNAAVFGFSLWLGAKIIDRVLKTENEKKVSAVVSEREILNN